MSSADEPLAVYPDAAANYTKVIIALNDHKSTRPAIADRVKVYANRSLACYKMADFKEALKDAQVAGTRPECGVTLFSVNLD